MKFRSFQPAMRLSRSRRLGKYVKDGVINWDGGLEKQIREEEDLPPFTGKITEKKEPTNDDIVKKVDELIEKIEEEE